MTRPERAYGAFAAVVSVAVLASSLAVSACEPTVPGGRIGSGLDHTTTTQAPPPVPAPDAPGGE